MAVLQVYCQPTSAGPMYFHARQGVMGGHRPVVAMLHGALRTSAELVRWPALLAEVADVILVDLPGHGLTPSASPPNLTNMAAVVGEGLEKALAGRKVLVVGESLGGLIALAVAGRAGATPIRAVLAADPPLSTAKLWNVQQNFRPLMVSGPRAAFIRAFAYEVFGITEASVEDRIYYPLFDQLNIPAHIVTGDLPLLPPRRMTGVACLIDDVDEFVVRRMNREVGIHRIQDSGHLLLVNAEAQCLSLIRDLLARHVEPAAAPTAVAQ